MHIIHGFTTRFLRPSEIDAKLISAWADLEARAIVPNAFLSPYFVLPALQYLVSGEDTFGVFVEKETAGIPNLVGVALFKVRKPTRSFPLPHLMTFESIHSYLSGFLLDKECAAEARRMIYDCLAQKKTSMARLIRQQCSD